MSTINNHVVSTWKIVEASLLRSVYRYNDRRVKREHNKLISEAYSLWYLATDDLLRSVGFTRTFVDQRWVNTLSLIDVHEVFLALKEADGVMLTQSFPSYETFKQSLRVRYPFIGDLLSPMNRVFAAWFSQEDHAAFSACHCFLSFPSRLNLQGLDGLEEKAVNDYLSRESSLQSDGFTDEEKTLISTWYPRSLELSSKFEENFEPRHGTGGTADGSRSVDCKYKSLGRDYLTDFLDKRIGETTSSPRQRTTFCRLAKLVMVPKSMLTYRSISMEPTTLMWYQQGVLRAFMADLERRPHHPLHKRFHPADQQSNRDLAWEGSVDGSFATIDLSSASDSVSWDLVKKWFRESVLYRWLLCTRSSRVELPDGSELAMKKYAPMGSALCFPIECIVFAAITECAIKEFGGDPRTSRYRVYGDDIVVESEYASAVISRLQQNGFEVNTSKTFSGTQFNWIFRESCGGEYLDGVDVTPIRLSRWFSGFEVNRHTPGRILSLIDLANDCNSRLPSVRRRCIHVLNSLPVNSRVLYNSTGEGGLFSSQPTNWHLQPAKWSLEHQVFKVSHGYSRVNHEDSVPEDEDIRLFEYLRRTNKRRRLLYPEDAVKVDITPLCAGTWGTTASTVEEI